MPLDAGIAKAAELAGFFAAHSVWCVSDGETLVPLFGDEGVNGERGLTRLAAEYLREGVELGKSMLEQNKARALRAVLVFDGYLTLNRARLDALLVTFVDYTGAAKIVVEMAVPYRAKKDTAGFAVHRPKLISFGGITDVQALTEAFFKGVEEHEQGSRVWSEFLDESA